MSLIFRPLIELCDASVASIDPKREPLREFLYIDISAVDNATKRIRSPQKVTGKLASVRARQVVRENDVLVSTTRPNLNAVALVAEEYDEQVCSSGFCVLRCGRELIPDYLFLFVQSPAFVQPLSELVKGGLYPAVTDKQVFAQQIPWRPLEEQQHIATQLNTQLAAVEEARQAAQTQLNDSKRLILAMLSATFDHLDDAEWRPIGEVAKTTSGTTPSRGQKDLWEPPLHPWVKTGEVAFKTIHQTEESVSAKALAECSLTLLPAGTVLVAMYGQGKTRGQSALLNVAATTNQACFAILPSAALDPEYLQFWLRHSYEALRSLSDSRGGNQSNLNGSLMNAFEVPLLPLEKQQAIACHIKQAIAYANELQQTIEQQLRDIELLPSRLLAAVFDAPAAL